MEAPRNDADELIGSKMRIFSADDIHPSAEKMVRRQWVAPERTSTRELTKMSFP
jgi:hypothetical protein